MKKISIIIIFILKEQNPWNTIEELRRSWFDSSETLEGLKTLHQ